MAGVRIKVIFLVLLAIGFGSIVYGRTSERLKVTLPHGGSLVGRYLTSFSGRGILAFLGVPYAKPPVGELRFKAPLPFDSWVGERLAIFDAPLCTQRDPYRRDDEISGVEDCLQLNVYVPEGPAQTGPLPVMVFFHGGGWQCGSGTRGFYGPDFLLDHDVIYIGANFRLGPHGFLSTEQEDCPGNNGLKDQNLVLKWIQKNIASFGGDPGLVTVFGESAGGASGTYHMMSPMSKGLFHRVISQSGVNLDSWAQPAHVGVARKRSIQLGDMLGCHQGRDGKFREMLDCLRKVSGEDVTKAFYGFFTWDTDPMIPFPLTMLPRSVIALLPILLYHLTSSHYVPPWNSCYALGCSTQQGCVPWNFQQYPCYRTCYYNRYHVPSQPKNKCYKITNTATGKSLASSDVLDPANKMKYATVSVNPPANYLWNVEPTYGGVVYIQNVNKLEFLKVDPSNNATYLVLNEPLDRAFQFRVINPKEGDSKIQLQSALNNGFLFVQNIGQGGSTVQITFDPFANYFQSLWTVMEFYC